MKSALLAALILALLGAFYFLFAVDPVEMEAESEAADRSAAPVEAGSPVSGANADGGAPGTTRHEVAAAAATGAGASGSGFGRLAFDGPAAIVTARLVDGAGRPASGAEARVARAAGGPAGLDWLPAPPESEEELDWPGIGAGADGVVRVEVPAGADLSVEFGGDYWRAQSRKVQALRAGEVADFGEIALTTASRVVGTIRGPDGAPLAGASVQLRAADAGAYSWDGHELLQEQTSDAEGRVAFGGVRGGRVRVEASAPRLANATLEALEVSGAATDFGFELRLERGGELAGFVVDSDRRPIADARLYLIHQKEHEFTWGDYLPPAPDREPDAISAADGSFRVAGLPPLAPAARSRTLLLAQADEVGVGAARQVRADQEVTITIARGVRVSGRVVSDGGEPLAGATVLLHQDTPWGYRAQKASVDSGEDGAFVLPLVPPGEYELTASASTGAAPPLTLDLLRDVGDLRLRIERDPLLTVLVVDPEGQPVPHARVEAHTPGVRGPAQTFSVAVEDGIIHHSNGAGWSATADADEHGRAVFRDPAAGELALTVSAKGWARLHARLQSSGGDQEETVQLDRPGALVVLVRDAAGSSVRGVTIHVRHPELDAEAPSQTTDHLGRAVWRDLAPGTWEVSHDGGRGGASAVSFDAAASLVLLDGAGGKAEASSPEGAPVRIEAGEQTEHEILLQDLALVTVRVERGGVPAPDVAVRLEAVQEEGEMFFSGWHSGGVQGARTDARGIAVLTPVQAGKYRLIGRSSRSAPDTEVELELHVGPQEAELRLNGAEVRGTLRDRDGPLSGATVSLTPYRPAAEGESEHGVAMMAISSGDGAFSITTGTDERAPTATSDQDGVYLFRDVPEGQWVVKARRKGVGPWTSLPFTVTGDAPVRVPEHTMLAGGVLHGRDANWSPPKDDAERFRFEWDQMIRLETAEGQMVGATQCDDRGNWRIEDLAEGEYVVHRGQWQSEPVRVGPGEERRVDVPKQERPARGE